MITAEQRNLSKGKPRTTTRHRLLLQEMIDNKGKSIRQALRRANYSVALQDNPKKVIETKGFQALLQETGLTPELISKSLVEDINNKKGKRVEELKLGADILRMRGNSTPDNAFTPTKIVITQINVDTHPETPSNMPPNASRTHESEAHVVREHIAIDNAPSAAQE